MGYLGLLTRLNLEDLFGGSKPDPITDPAKVVTGLFRQVLRVNPTDTELQNYLDIYKRAGVNGIVAGLYSSTAFRQAEVNNYYLEMLGRPATEPELNAGTKKLVWGQLEQTLVSSIASSADFYDASSGNPSPNGVQPSATTFVNLLYRSLLGKAASSDPVTSSGYIQRTEGWVPRWFTTAQFVTDAPYRTVKIGEVYSVVGYTPTDQQINTAVRNWIWYGGLAGIATTVLASADNIKDIETFGVTLPDLVAVEQLQKLLLTPYNPHPNEPNPVLDGKSFTEQLDYAVHHNPDGTDCAGGTACNTGLLDLIRYGGTFRGTPNEAITLTQLTKTADAPKLTGMIPTQNEIDVDKSLNFPLKDPTTTRLYLAGGVITPPGGVGDSVTQAVWTSDGGRYIIDGHHRWSSIYLLNPDAQVIALDFNYVPDPQTALKETQLAIMAANEKFKSGSASPDNNVFTISEAKFKEKVEVLILNDPATEKLPNKTTEVIQAFVDYLHLDPTATQQEKIVSIQNYLWGNVERMRAENQPVNEATNRILMPQAVDPIETTLAYLGGRTLSYSFPLIPFLG